MAYQLPDQPSCSCLVTAVAEENFEGSDDDNNDGDVVSVVATRRGALLFSHGTWFHITLFTREIVLQKAPRIINVPMNKLHGKRALEFKTRKRF